MVSVTSVLIIHFTTITPPSRHRLTLLWQRTRSSAAIVIADASWCFMSMFSWHSRLFAFCYFQTSTRVSTGHPLFFHALTVQALKPFQWILAMSLGLEFMSVGTFLSTCCFASGCLWKQWHHLSCPNPVNHTNTVDFIFVSGRKSSFQRMVKQLVCFPFDFLQS